MGLAPGGAYAQIAPGLTIQYGVARVMNRGSGEIAMAGTFFTRAPATGFVLSPLIGPTPTAALGRGLSRALYGRPPRPTARRAATPAALEIDTILLTFGLMLLAQGLFTMGFGPSFNGCFRMQSPARVPGAGIAGGKALGLLLAALIGGELLFAAMRTRWGVRLRAVAAHPEWAALVGIDRDRAARSAFALGGAIAASAGAILSMHQPFTAADGGFLTMKAIVIVGGVGVLGGALPAGLMVGMVEALVAWAVDPGLTRAAACAILLAVLLRRPKGLFAWPIRPANPSWGRRSSGSRRRSSPAITPTACARGS